MAYRGICGADSATRSGSICEIPEMWFDRGAAAFFFDVVEIGSVPERWHP